ncbi:MAG: ATP-binding protein [Candidatus Thiodiazotropha sp.]
MLHDVINHQQRSSIQVLLVDDNPDIANKTAQLLQHLDIQQNVECHNVRLMSDAITEVSQAHYDIILLDIGLADISSPRAIHSLRDAFAYAPIIATSKIDDPELAATWVDEGADDCIYMGVVNERILSRIIKHTLKRFQTYRELHQRSRTHHILNTLLSLSMQEMPFEQLLQECLEIILSAPMAEMLHKGGIFVTKESNQSLRMLAHANLDKEVIALCNEVAFGHCLCGRVAQSGEMHFANCVKYEHQNKTTGIQPHSHYILPINSKGKVLGVLLLYFKYGHIRKMEDETFLRGVSDTLAGIVERARTSEQLIIANEQNNRLLSSLTSILIGVDKQDCISHWNEEAEQLFGIAAEEVLGKPIASSIIGWDWTQVTSHFQKKEDEQKQTNRFEVRFQPESGPNRLLSVGVTPFRSEKDSNVGYLLIADDVTEQKQLESEMLRLQKLQSIGQLAAGIAHEINTPIQYIGDNMLFLRDAFDDIHEIIQVEHEIVEAARYGSVSAEHIVQLDNKIEELDLKYLQEEVPKTIKQTLDGVDHVATIVRAMKQFSHPGLKEKAPTDINKSVNSTVAMTRNIWKYHADIQLNLDPSLPQVHCITGSINEVILNIMANAAHAVAEKVDSSGEKGLIHITTRCEGNYVEIHISDTGTGIPENARDHVFDPFFTTKDVGQGTGQGLSLSHQIIVEQHNGELSFETEMGVGTTFTVKLPLLEENSLE